MIGTGKIGVNSFGTNIILDTFNNRVFKHQMFSVSKRVELSGNDLLWVVFDPTENGVFPKDTLVLLPFFVKATGGGSIQIDIFYGLDSDTDGTIVNAIDKNYLNSVVPHSTIRLNPTINNIGEQSPLEDRMFSVAGQGNSSDNTDISNEALLSVLDPSIKYAIRLTNTSTDTANIVAKLKWFEV